MFGCLKRDLKTEIRVAQLAGYISEHSAYHHGEASLNETIIGMAQTFVGANNINLLEPIGQFGSRLLGGDDASSPRYIHTHLTKIASVIFKKEDTPVLKYLDDDGLPVEPQWYSPIIPMILVNGCWGIGTGYTSRIPSFEPTKIVAAIRDRIHKIETASAESRLTIGLPWWRGFTGTITQEETNKYIINGKFKFVDDNTLEITELPVGTWTKKYRENLETLLNKSPMCKEPLIKDIRDEYNDLDVKFIIEFMPDVLSGLMESGKLLKTLKLETAYHTNNMWLFDANGKMKRYETPEEILDEFVIERLKVYYDRKLSMLDSLRKQHILLSAKALFIKLVCDDIIDLRKSTDDKIAEVLRENKLPELDSPTTGGVGTSRDVLSGWKYLMVLPVRTLTPSKREQLLKEVGDLETEISLLEKQTPEDLWEADLQEFEKAYMEFIREREDADSDIRNEVVIKKSKIPPQRRNLLEEPKVPTTTKRRQGGHS
jgi:DNA topoisomerase-2